MFNLRHRRKARERIAIERFGLPGRLVPRSILIADDLRRHDHAIAAQLIGSGDAVIKFSVSADVGCILVDVGHPLLDASLCFNNNVREGLASDMPTNRNHLQCNVCGVKTITRVSVVYGPYREFAFACPGCAVEIRLGVEVVVPSEDDIKRWSENNELSGEFFVPDAEYPKLINAEWLKYAK